MNEQYKLNLVSEEVFADKLDKLTAVLSAFPTSSEAKLMLLTDPNDPTKFILSQNNVDVTQAVRDLILIDSPELQLEALQKDVAELKQVVAALQSEIVTKTDLVTEVQAAVKEEQAWGEF
jgi:hypothetical protein